MTIFNYREPATSLLARIKTVDGAGSGLDADLLDGLSSAAFQPVDSELTAIAGLTSAANKLPYFTGSGTAALADFTAFGRSLVDDADATAARTTLGLGTIATQSAASVAITGGTINGAAIGGTTPAAGAFTTLGASGIASLTNTTEATAIGTAGVVLSGGLSVAKKIMFAGTLTAKVNDGASLSLDLSDTATSRTVAMFRVNTSATAHTTAALFDVVSSASTSSDKMVRVRANSVDVWTMAADGTGTWVGPQSFTNTGTSLSASGDINVATGKTYKVNSVQVVGGRKTGWTVCTGTALRTGFDTATATLTQIAQTLKALIDDLHGTAGHGVIGT